MTTWAITKITNWAFCKIAATLGASLKTAWKGGLSGDNILYLPFVAMGFSHVRNFLYTQLRPITS